MNPDDKIRLAAGETDQPPSAPEQKQQDDPQLNHLDGDIDMDAARAVPNTGRPADTGDVDVHPEDVQLL